MKEVDKMTNMKRILSVVLHPCAQLQSGKTGKYDRIYKMLKRYDICPPISVDM